MQYDDFIDRVQQRAGLDARPESQIFPLEEFFKRVSARASVRQSEAAEQA